MSVVFSRIGKTRSKNSFRKLIAGRYKINKLLSGLLVFRKIIRSAQGLSSKFHRCPGSLASRPSVHFSDNHSALGITDPIQQPPEGFYSTKCQHVRVIC